MQTLPEPNLNIRYGQIMLRESEQRLHELQAYAAHGDAEAYRRLAQTMTPRAEADTQRVRDFVKRRATAR